VKLAYKAFHARPRGPFSILKRIGVGETGSVGEGDARRADFQYPQTDRSG